MYPDQLRIMNPGGLFGAVDITRLGEERVSSSRNSLLLRLLEDIPAPHERRTVCENRGSGIRIMCAQLAQAGMSPPEFKDKVTSFEVALPNHTLFDEETMEWLSLLGGDGLKDTQRTALALMRRGTVLDNAKYRAAAGISDSRVATAQLQDLVARELIEQAGTRGGARYRLSEYATSLASPDDIRKVRPNRRRQILQLLSLRSELSKTEISGLLNINPKTAEHWISRLKKEGLIEATETGRGNKNTRYRAVPYQEDMPDQGTAKESSSPTVRIVDPAVTTRSSDR
jgi:ATP-dependent DNA helicase RecG